MGISQIANSDKIKGWHLYDSEHDDYRIGIEKCGRESGSNCGFIESIVRDSDSEEDKNKSGHLVQCCGVDDYLGERIRMKAWVKSELEPGAVGRLELMSIGQWGRYCKWNGTFDNMSDRPIIGTTDWKQYEMVVDVLRGSYSMTFGLFLIGMGKMWLDDITFEIVEKSVPLTGLIPGPINLSFEE
tara:strand:- start:192 stop:746 length:555 start_codon:yes stop_codon:yes gene_type:complete